MENAWGQKKERILITGGTKGIGKEIAKEFFNSNSEIAICARKINEDKESDFQSYKVDLGDRNQAQEFVRDATETLGGLDLVILNAALSGVEHEGDGEEIKKERQKELFKVNQVGQIAIIREAVEMLKISKGTLVFVTSGLAKFVEIKKNIEIDEDNKKHITKESTINVPENAPDFFKKAIIASQDYAIGKARIEEYLKKIKSKYPEVKILFINPGPTDTDMHREIREQGTQEIKTFSNNIGTLRNPEIIGKIISKISATGMTWNPTTKLYEIPAPELETINISDENIEFEKLN